MAKAATVEAKRSSLSCARGGAILSRHLILLTLTLSACAGKADNSPSDDTGPDSAEPEMVEVFPAGASSWTGTAVLSGMTLDVALDLTRTGTALEGTVSAEMSGRTLNFGVRGTVDDQSGLFGLVPTGWVGADPGLTLVGIAGAYDPETGTLSGMVRDSSSWDAPTTEGGAFLATGVTPPDVVELASITAEYQVSEAGVSYSGTSQCTSTARPVLGTLTRGADGQISGTLSFSEVNGTYVGSFDVIGVENASSGGLTLLPVAWTEEETDDTNYENYYVDGTVSAGSCSATVYLHTNVPCPEGGFQVIFE